MDRRWGSMRTVQVLAVILIIAGVLGLIYGQFRYTKRTHDAKIGPLQLELKEKEIVHVPTWVGVGAIAVGVILLLAGKRR